MEKKLSFGRYTRADWKARQRYMTWRVRRLLREAIDLELLVHPDSEMEVALKKVTHALADAQGKDVKPVRVGELIGSMPIAVLKEMIREAEMRLKKKTAEECARVGR